MLSIAPSIVIFTVKNIMLITRMCFMLSPSCQQWEEAYHYDQLSENAAMAKVFNFRENIYFFKNFNNFLLTFIDLCGDHSHP